MINELNNIKLKKLMKNYYILNKTPLRVSLFGGGTDFKDFFEKKQGSTISFTINQFIYTTLKKHYGKIFNENVRLNYSRVERLNNFGSIKNDIIRETLNYFNYQNPIYLSTVSDIPAGTGLGSSSSFIVGLVKSLSTFKKKLNKHQIAILASKIEIEKLKSPIGVQDHFIASYGGFKKINYYKNNIQVIPLTKYEKDLKKILNHSLFIWLKKTRSANEILSYQKQNIEKNFANLKYLYELQECFYKELKSNISLKIFGELLKESWITKKKISKKISNKKIEEIVNILESNNCLGYKVLGAGGGGFLMAVFENDDKKRFLKKYEKKFNFLEFNYYPKGTENIVENI